MARIDNVRRIIREEFKSEDREMIGKLSYILNSFMEQVVRQFNGNVDFTNLAQDITTFRIKVDANGIPVGNNQVRTSVKNASGVYVVKAVNVDNPSTYPTAAPFISFDISTKNSELLKINKVSGLQSNTDYDLTIVVIP